MNKLLSFILTILIITNCNYVSTVDAVWFNITWDYYRPIEVNISANATDYQLLINITNKTNAQSDCSDMRFTMEDNVTELSYWIEECNTSLSYALIWINVTLDTYNETQIGYWYGNTSAVTSQSDKDAVFGVHARALYPFRGNADDIFNVANGTVTDATLTTDRAGNADSAYLFDGAGDYIQLCGSASPFFTNLTQERSLVLWIQIQDEGHYHFVFNDRTDTGIWKSLWYTDQKVYAYWVGSSQVQVNSDALSKDIWYHVVYTYNVTHGTLYINGNYVNSVAVPGNALIVISATSFRLGADESAANTLNGTIDSARIYNKSLSATEASNLYVALEPTYSIGSEIKESADTAPTVTLNTPTDTSTENSLTVSFVFTPSDDSGFTNCSLWTNESGWSQKHINTTTISNGSTNTIAETFSSFGDFLWNVECYDDASQSAFASSNYTITLVEPITTTITLYLDDAAADRYYELGTVAQLKANITNSSGDILNLEICLDIESVNYGDDYICANETVEYNWTSEIAISKFNDSTTTKTLSYSSASNETVYFGSHSANDILGLSFNITGINDSGYPGYYKIYINDTLSNIFIATLKPGTHTQDKYDDDTVTEYNITFINTNTQTVYFNINKNAEVTTAVLNISGYETELEGIYIESFDVSDQLGWGDALTTDGTYIWIIYKNDIYKYYLNGTYISMVVLSPSYVSGKGLTTNGTYIWVADAYSDRVQKYNMDGTHVDYFSTYVGYALSGVTTDNTNIWTLYSQNKVRKHYMNGTYIEEWDINGTDVSGITTNNSNLWINDEDDYVVRKYNMTGTYIENWTITGGNVNNIGITTDDTFFWILGVTTDKVYKYYLNGTSFPSDVFIDIEEDGLREYSGSDELNTTSSPVTIDDFAYNITNFLGTCTADADGDCQTPIRVGTSTYGIVELSALNVTYDLTFNPIELDLTTLNDYIDTFDDQAVNIPINIESNQGNITVDDINFSYDGDHNLNITAHFEGNATYSASTTTQYVKAIWSNYILDLPSLIDWIIFVPSTPTSDDVTPIGQTPSRPIINVTIDTENNKNMSWYFMLNETHSCINLTVSNTSTKADGDSMNTSWFEYADNVDDDSYFGIYMWNDYGCNDTVWKQWSPTYYYRGCCEGCICSEDVS